MYEGSRCLTRRGSHLQVYPKAYQPCISFAEESREGETSSWPRRMGGRTYNFTCIGPPRSKQPVRWPYSTNATRHMSNICNEETMGVGLVWRDANRRSSTAWIYSGMVNTHVDLVVAIVDQAQVLSICSVFVIDKAMRRVSAGIKAETVEKITGVVIVDLTICGSCKYVWYCKVCCKCVNCDCVYSIKTNQEAGTDEGSFESHVGTCFEAEDDWCVYAGFE